MTGTPLYTWDDLQYFLAVARTGQLSTAARHLRSSHATVARRIERLEYALKVKLFERNPRGYVLTSIGRRLVETAETIERAANELQSEIGGEAGTQRGSVRLSALEGFGNFFLMPRLPDFLKAYPNITLELVTIQQIMSLARREADITIVLEPPKIGLYVSELLGDYDLAIFASKAYLEAAGPIKSREDIPDHPFIGYIEDMIFSPSLDYLSEIHPRLRANFQSSSIHAQLSAVRSGFGLSVLPFFMTRLYPDLVQVLPEIHLRRSLWVMCHRDIEAVPRVRLVVDFLKETVRSNRELLMR
ncbi:transcriptional regulator, LysR family [Fulvimarina manganoxydans]|uniref:Transcriptional regulator, LysR family n=1 Tax=Fulvimarina manganoxydans TaxID=937218 RepID=A0A1W2ET05_9HYPH|nr:LysR family transcriptional regulator [Fulvimarina manganoxydans]MCK5933860.1 LysR family transcriptional regulator [Fulvimarina manganoxydans]MEE2953174.1 LysR family transcriptional regulator [Pseudomonadota bacterium]SMD12827.1 transcriptional regulator, LysR family [Fulvimarina manganoxydans]